MNILFWNTGGNKINQYIGSIVNDYSVDIIVLAEYKDEEQDLFQVVRDYHRKINKFFAAGCDRVVMYGNSLDVEPATQNKYYSIQLIGHEFILCGVHFPSDLHGNRTEERYVLTQDMMSKIHAVEEKNNTRKTIIIGDINDMPYSKCCLNANCLHGLSFFQEGKSKERTVLGNLYRKYYNPMWNFFGDFSYPPGTYYKKRSELNAPEWYILDQVIVGYDIAPFIDHDCIKIVTKCSRGNLIDKNGHPNKKISDHFPIFCRIDEYK